MKMLSAVTVLVGMAVVAITVLWRYSTSYFNYWNARGVPTAPDAVPFFGHYLKLLSLRNSKWIYIDEVYRKYGGSRICGMYEQHRPVLLIGDPELVKTVMMRDFDHFVDRRYVPLKTSTDAIFSELLNRLTGAQWKAARAKLSPLFTSGKLKGLYPLIEAKAENLVAYIGREMKRKSALPLKRTFGFFSMEVITSFAFGVETNTFAEDGSIFSTNAERMFSYGWKDICKATLHRLAPRLCWLLSVNLSTPEMKFFTTTVQEVMLRRQLGERRGDFLDLMMALKEEEQTNSAPKTSEFIMKESSIVATSVLFVTAGYDTISTMLSFVAHQLATHRKYQVMVRQELLTLVKQHGDLTYDALMEAKLLDAVISETLRLYPPAVQMERQCTKDYRLPGTSVTVEAGTVVIVPTWSLHRDPCYWSNPEAFLPDRFLPDKKDKILTGTYLPFGLGPRNCIGMRFALMEAKLALAKVLLRFELSHPPNKEQRIHSLKFMRPPVDLGLAFTQLEE